MHQKGDLAPGKTTENSVVYTLVFGINFYK